jgi:hypothetical protein
MRSGHGRRMATAAAAGGGGPAEEESEPGGYTQISGVLLQIFGSRLIIAIRIRGVSENTNPNELQITPDLDRGLFETSQGCFYKTFGWRSNLHAAARRSAAGRHSVGRWVPLLPPAGRQMEMTGMTCVPGWEVSLHTSFVALLPPTRGGPLATRRRHLTYKARCGEQAERRCPPHRLAPPPFSSGLGASPVRACVCEGRRLSSARVRYPELTRTAPPSVHRCSAVRRIPNFALPPRYPPPAHHRLLPPPAAALLLDQPQYSADGISTGGGTARFARTSVEMGVTPPVESRCRLICVDSVHAGRPVFYKTDGDVLELT